MSEHNLSAQEFAALLELYGEADPLPVSEIDGNRIRELLNEEAQSRDYESWVEAYNELR